jgi:hypothetical protein
LNNDLEGEPMTLDVREREQAIKSAMDLYTSTNAKRTLTVDFRGAPLDLPVITITPNVAILNHDNNRLAAQLIDHPQVDLVQSDPLSPEAQAVISSVLAATSEYEQLKAELKLVGQKDPGLITRDGLLINGNTRAVALREINAQGMFVALLPSGVLPEDIIALEVDLQMVKKTHQDYTFTNQLLLLERLRASFTNPTDLAKRMNWIKNGAKKVAQHSRILGIINEVRALEPNHPFPYSFFDTKSEHLKNLDDEYQKLVATSVADAEMMKWSRLSAMLLGVAKDQVREIDEEFISDEVIKRLEDADALKILESDAVSPDDGLGDLLGKPEAKYDLKKVAKMLVQQKLDLEVSVEGEIVKQDTLHDIETAIRLAAEDRITQQKLANYLAEPSDVLRETRIGLERILEQYVQISSTKGFDKGKFGFELAKVTKTIADLEKKYKA